MAKNVYLGVNGKADKIKKIYFGVSNKARKIKKGYIGVNGKARLFYTSYLEFSFDGTSLSASHTREYDNYLTSVIGNYALFGFGDNYDYTNTDYSIIDTYNRSLSHGTVKLRESKFGGSPVANDNYAFFAGGKNGKGTIYATVDAFNGNLVRTSAPNLSSARAYLTGTRLGDSVLFFGGNTSTSGYNMSYTIDVYNSSLTKSTISSRYAAMLAGQGYSSNRAVFFGGSTNGGIGSSDSTLSDKIEFINSSLTVELYSTLGTGTSGDDAQGKAITVDDKNIIICTTRARSSIPIYNSSLTKSTISDNRSMGDMGGSPMHSVKGWNGNGYAISTGTTDQNYMNVFDSSLTLKIYSIFDNSHGLYKGYGDMALLGDKLFAQGERTKGIDVATVSL